MSSLWPITLFADEVDAAYAKQAAFIKEEGLDGLDLRSANGRNVTALLRDDCEEIKASGVKIQCIGSPVNKVPLRESLHEAEMEKLSRAIQAALNMGCERIRIFSPEPEGENASARTIAWLKPMVDLAERNDVILLHENDALFFGAHPADSQTLLHEFGGPNFKAAFDFANTVLIGHKPWDDWFPWILPYLDTLHIKDARFAARQVVPAGEGEGEIARTLAWLKDKGWKGTLTLEPHLAVAGRLGGFSGADLCRRAHRALLGILEDIK